MYCMSCSKLQIKNYGWSKCHCKRGIVALCKCGQKPIGYCYCCPKAVFSLSFAMNVYENIVLSNR